MIETRILKALDPLLVHADARGNQVRIEPKLGGVGDELFQILAHQRFAAREAKLNGAHLARLAHDLFPFLGRELILILGDLDRVRAVGALQRATVGQFAQEPVRASHPFRHRRDRQRMLRLVDDTPCRHFRVVAGGLHPAARPGLGQKAQRVLVNILTAKRFAQLSEDLIHRRGAVDPTQNLCSRPGKFDHALGVEQDPVILTRLPLESQQ